MANYNINAVTRRVVYTGSAGTGPYSFTFEVLVQTDLAVYFNSAKLTLTTDYTVTINANGTGSITIVTGTNVPSTPTGSDTITIIGARNIERTTDFVTAGELRAAALNEQLDALTIFDQQIAEENKRQLIAPEYDPAHVDDGGTLDMTLPAKEDRLGRVLSFNSSTGNPEVTVSTAEVTGAAASAAAAASSATAAASSASSASSSASTATTKASEASASAAEAAASAASAAVTIASQAEAEAGTDNANLMTPLRTKQAVDGYGLLAANNLSDVGSAATARTNLGLGTAATLTAGTSANNAVQLDGSGALPAVSGAALTDIASGGTVDLTASGAITAGKTLILNSDGTVSQIATNAITEVIGSAYTPTNSTASDTGWMAYNTTADRFMVVGSETISATTGLFATVLELDSSMAITETVAPTTVSGAIAIYSAEYNSTHDRVLCHYQNSSPFYVGVNTISYSVANGLDIDSVTNVNTSNQPYGSTTFIDNNDATIASVYGTTTSTTTHKMRFGALTAGSDASLDSIAYGTEVDTGVSSGGLTYHYYHTFIEFPVENYLMILKHEYASANDYRIRLSYGTTSGVGTSTTYTESGEDNWSDTDRFDYQGGPFYNADLNRGIWFDGKHLRTLSMAGGSYNKSALHTVQSAFPTNPGHDSVAIPGTNKIVLFAGDNANSDRLSYWVVTVTAGSTAATDTFSTDGPHEISTDVVYYGLGAAYSPDVDGFLVRMRLNGTGSKTYGVRVGRSSTNITATNFLGFASNSASDGQTVTVQLPGSIAVPTQGSLTVGTTYYVNADGTIGTTNAGYGKAGRAVSSTQLVVEERA